MKHYSRENERAQDQIAELEKRRSALEANVAAISACWEQVGIFFFHEVSSPTICTESIPAY